MTERFVNGHEAVRMSGFSLTKFTSSKTRALLEQHGGSFEGKASNWRIPVGALPLLGTPRSRRSAVKVVAKSDIEQIRAELAASEQKTAEIRDEYEAAKKETQRLRRTLKNAAAKIIKQAESEQAALKEQQRLAELRLDEAKKLIDED
ncbi:MAG: hypothetical protein LKF88_02515 [Microbacteriaceae bacterium]|jgi:hypothetical protein|nr:hypothetical protein [Microbacteriaceae bacterium]MCI1207758.1 hypothetical protein [Microbacteriaceae bacterium]